MTSAPPGMNVAKLVTPVAVGAALIAGGLVVATSGGEAATTITVYKSPTCGCCNDWIAHLEAAGFAVEAHDRNDMGTVKNELGVFAELGSCHTGVVDGYVIEGHVPADVIARLLTERPDVAGLAVPGMPIGSPGMEGPNAQPYDIVAFGRDGSVGVYDRR